MGAGHPIFAQPLDIMARYVEAFHKVVDNIDQVLEVETEDAGEQVAGTVVHE